MSPTLELTPAPPVRAEPSLHSAPHARWPLETAGLVTGVALALVAVGHLVATPRAWVLFSDADSVLPALIHASLAIGQPQHWSLSAVLFLPETALYLLIAAVVHGTRATLAVNAVVNLVLLYAVLRVSASLSAPRTTRGRQVAGALLALGVLVALTFLDSSRAWDAAELPSLLATTTYYSATVLALVLAPALVVHAATRSGRSHRAALLALVVLSAASTLTNPLYAGWVTVPLALALLVVAGRALVRWSALVASCAALGGGTAAGFLLRIPLGDLVARDASGYADPGQALHVLFGYYLRLTIDRMSTAPGAASVSADLLLLALCGCLLVRGVRRGEPEQAIVAAFAVAAPVVVLIGAVALGTTAYRYLQPAYFAPLPAVALLPSLLPRLRPAGRAVLRRSAPVVAALLVVASLLGTSGIARAASAVDPSIRCLDDWVTASHRTGAGRFFTVRGPKAYLPDPRQLIQVTRAFDGYAWLVNREDYRVRRVSFVVSDTTTAAPAVHPLPGAPTPTLVVCGRYRITDYHLSVLPIGPLTSAYDP